jgi:prophage antirepressor-like protein
MNHLQTFTFNAVAVRVIMQGDETWWIAKDVCDVLGTRTDTVPVILDEDEFTKVDPNSIGVGTNAPHGITIINEPGLYSLILRSRKPEAKAFKRWVTHEVLPSIRKTGGYEVEGRKIPETYIDALRALADSEEEKIKAIHDLGVATTKVAALLPDALYAQDIAKSTTLLTTTIIAKQLGTNGAALNRFLKEKRVIFKQSSTWMPYAKYEHDGLHKIIVHDYTKPDGSKGTSNQLKWTEKGRRFIHDLWNKHHAIEVAK